MADIVEESTQRMALIDEGIKNIPYIRLSSNFQYFKRIECLLNTLQFGFVTVLAEAIECVCNYGENVRQA